MKAFTDISQSRKLAEILPLESADQTWARIAIAGANLDVPEELQYRHNGDMPFKYYSGIGTPCWSLAALLDLIPEYIKFNDHTWKFYLDHCGMYYMNVDTYDTNTFSSSIGILIDDAFEIILKLKEKNLL